MTQPLSYSRLKGADNALLSVKQGCCRVACGAGVVVSLVDGGVVWAGDALATCIAWLGCVHFQAALAHTLCGPDWCYLQGMDTNSSIRVL